MQVRVTRWRAEIKNTTLDLIVPLEICLERSKDVQNKLENFASYENGLIVLKPLEQAQREG